MKCQIMKHNHCIIFVTMIDVLSTPQTVCNTGIYPHVCTIKEINTTNTIIGLVSGHDLCYQPFGRFSNKVFRQIVGIAMGTNCAPLIIDLFYTIMNLYL